MKKILLLLFFLPVLANGQVIITIAGNKFSGFSGDDGPATYARLNGPTGIMAVTDGGLLIADQRNNRIRRISVNGIITTFAGTGVAGYMGDAGPATIAEFNQPYGIAGDKAGNIFISDRLNNCIRMIDPTGAISTIAGNGTAGYSGDGGDGTDALLNGPTGLCLDKSGNLFFADTYNNTIRKVDPYGVISTVAGNGTAGFSGDSGSAMIATLNGPSGVAVDDTGAIYIADQLNNRIRVINRAGIITTIAGKDTAGYSGDGADGKLAKLNGPADVKFDAGGKLYFTDQMNSVIRYLQFQRVYYSADQWIVNTAVGNGVAGYSGDNGPASAASLKRSPSLAFDDKGNLLIADESNNVIREVVYPPSAGIAPYSAVLCMDSCATFVNTSTGTVDSFSWSTYYPMTGARTDTAGACFHDNGEFGVKLYIANIAGSSSVIAKVVCFSPNPGIYRKGNTMIAGAGTGLSYYTIFSQQWYFNGVPIPGATSLSYEADQDGTYEIRIVGMCGMGKASFDFVVNGVPNMVRDGKISVFPNPVEQTLTVTTDELYPIHSLTVMNLLGESMLATTGNATSRVPLDVSSLAPGVYFIRINGSETRRFIKK